MSEIRSASCPRCYLCGGTGLVIHDGLADKLFGAAGSWSLKQCPDEACGLLWMDPMPLPEELSKAYINYYTHDNEKEGVRVGQLRRLYREVKLAHLSRSLGYKSVQVSRLARLISRLLLFFPQRRTEIESEVVFLPARRDGRLLDIGCGSGHRMKQMLSLGWRASGIDFDEKAVSAARQRGLDVSCGTIPGKWFPPNSFDAIIMNHVIEHVPNPIELLAECARILKPGGQVVMTTPNNASLGHRLFKMNWRGLEPPRHLHIFCRSSIESLLKKAGFQHIFVRTFDSAYVWRLSLMLRFRLTQSPAKKAQVRFAKLAAVIFNFVERIVCRFNPSAGECLCAVATKPPASSDH